MTNVNELKELYIALGGEASDVAECTTNVDVLNALAAKYEGAGNAQTNAQALANIVAVAQNIGGGADPVLADVTITNYVSAKLTIYSYEIAETKDGKAIVYGKMTELDGNKSGKSATVKVPASIIDPDEGTYRADGFIEMKFQSSQVFIGRSVGISNGYIFEKATNEQSNGWFLRVAGGYEGGTPTVKVINAES